MPTGESTEDCPNAQNDDYVSCPTVIAWQKRLQQRYMAAPKLGGAPHDPDAAGACLP